MITKTKKRRMRIIFKMRMMKKKIKIQLPVHKGENESLNHLTKLLKFNNNPLKYRFSHLIPNQSSSINTSYQRAMNNNNLNREVSIANSNISNSSREAFIREIMEMPLGR